jgi:hypothetical protein
MPCRHTTINKSSACKRGELKPSEIAETPKATPELAGKVLLARAIMNLDEAITKP